MKMPLTHEGNNMHEGYSKVPPGACGSKLPDRCAVFPNLIEELRHFAPVPFAERAMTCEMKSQRLEAGQEGEIHLSRTAARRGIYHRADRAERGRLFGRIS
jgi:hypothetical protein